MGKFFLIYLIFAILGNPIMALIVVVILFLLLDRRYMRWFPRLIRKLKDGQRLRQLLREIEANPHNVTDKLEIGRLYADRKRFTTAIPYLEEALERIQNHADGLFYLGLSYLHTGRESVGVDKIEEALEMNARVRYGEPYLQLAEYYKSKGNHTEALHSLQRSDEAGIANAEIEYRKGQILHKLGEKEKAANAFHSAIQYHRTAPKYLKKESRRWALLARLAKFLS